MYFLLPSWSPSVGPVGGRDVMRAKLIRTGWFGAWRVRCLGANFRMVVRAGGMRGATITRSPHFDTTLTTRPETCVSRQDRVVCLSFAPRFVHPCGTHHLYAQEGIKFRYTARRRPVVANFGYRVPRSTRCTSSDTPPLRTAAHPPCTSMTAQGRVSPPAPSFFRSTVSIRMEPAIARIPINIHTYHNSRFNCTAVREVGNAQMMRW